MPPGMKSKAKMGGMSDGKPKPPGMAPEMPDMDEKPDDGGGKASRADALVIPETHRCDSCANYDTTSGECAKVEGYFEPGAACLRFFEASGEGEEEHAEPDADDMGGPSDNDADNA